LAMLTIASLYTDLRLPLAAKANALAVAAVAMSSGDDSLVDLVPAGLVAAAHADFLAGAWCAAVEIFEVALLAQYNLVEDGLNIDKHEGLQTALLDLVYISACARDLVLGFDVRVNGLLESLGLACP